MRNNNNAGCLSALLPAFSRMMLLMYWISRPAMMNAAFSTFILPCLGFMFLPFATLMYVWLIQGVGGIQGLDWLWLGLSGAAGRRERRRPGLCQSQPPAGRQCRFNHDPVTVKELCSCPAIQLRDNCGQPRQSSYSKVEK